MQKARSHTFEQLRTTRRRNLRRFLPRAGGTGNGAGLRRLDSLPVETGLPFVGMSVHLLQHKFDIRHLFEKNGPAFVIDLGPLGSALALDQTNEIRDVLLTHANDYSMAWPASTARMVFGRDTFRSWAEARPWRAALNRVLSPDAVATLQLPTFAPAFAQRVRDAVARGERVLWYEESRYLAFSVAARVALGTLLSDEDLRRLYPDFLDLSKATFALDFGFKEGLPFTAFRRGVEARRRLFAFLEAKIAAAVADSASIEADTAIARLVRGLQEERGGDAASSHAALAAEMADETLFLLFAGTDTTSYTLTQAAMRLARAPEWLEALHVEQDALVAERGEAIDRHVLSRSPVALAIAQEMLRLNPPVLLTYRRALRDTVLAGVAVPEGTLVLAAWKRVLLETAPPAATGATDPGAFDPGRWLDAARSTCAPNDAPGNFAFGAGQRHCVGQHLAMAEAIATLAILGREVGGIEMSEEEATRELTSVEGHPTGLPVLLWPRAPGAAAAAARGAAAARAPAAR